MLSQDDDDPGLRAIRELRVAELKRQHEELLVNKAKGHGEYREIVEADFLKEVPSPSARSRDPVPWLRMSTLPLHLNPMCYTDDGPRYMRQTHFAEHGISVARC